MAPFKNNTFRKYPGGEIIYFWRNSPLESASIFIVFIVGSLLDSVTELWGAKADKGRATGYHRLPTTLQV